MMTKKEKDILLFLKDKWPVTGPSLDFDSPFQCIIAVMLSAQTNDTAVNKVTGPLFFKYPTPFEMAKARQEDIEMIIKSIGLYRNKATNAIGLSKILVEKYGGEVPKDKTILQSLPGVGIKTANVVGAACFGMPSIAVDTHVSRIGKRLGYGREKDEPATIEKNLEKHFDKNEWIELHYRLITFGRQICHSQNPACNECGLQKYCHYFSNKESNKGK